MKTTTRIATLAVVSLLALAGCSRTSSDPVQANSSVTPGANASVLLRSASGRHQRSGPSSRTAGYGTQSDGRSIYCVAG